MRSDSLRLAIVLCISVQVGHALAAEKPTHQPIDWNGDGVLDLVDVSPENRSTSSLRVYTGIADSKPPAFSAPVEIAVDGDVPADLTARALTDWDGDGDVDLLVCAKNQISLWDNTAGRGVAVRLDAPRKLVAIESSDVREELSRFGNAATFQCQAMTAADWEGDGDQDLLIVMASSDGDLTLVELLERSSESTTRPSGYAPPRAIRDDRGLPVMSRAGLAMRSILYMDWDRDGDLDLLYYDTTPRPSDAGGWLMYLENDNTRQQPILIHPLTILPIAGAPFALDWNKDKQIDLLVGGELFTNMNPKSSTDLPTEPPFRPGGSRRSHPWTLPRFERTGTMSQPAAQAADGKR